jgi:hypothetical protein
MVRQSWFAPIFSTLLACDRWFRFDRATERRNRECAIAADS